MTHAESWSITSTAAHGRKAATNNCKKYNGQNKSGKSGLCLATQPYIANFLPVLSSVGIDKALLELVLLNVWVNVVPHTEFDELPIKWSRDI